jgi:hypothetical protein
VTTAVKTALCEACKARRDAADGRTREFAERTTPDYPDVTAPRVHRLTITVWNTCTECPGRAR